MYFFRLGFSSKQEVKTSSPPKWIMPSGKVELKSLKIPYMSS
jgi:hypothetical protein